MSTFSKSTISRFPDFSILVSLVQETPGPGEYAIPTSTILNQDPNKHFGFLEKSDRFRTLSKEEASEFLGFEEQGSKPVHHKREHRGEDEKLQKLKTDNQKMRDQYDRLIQSQEKEYKMLYEKYQKLDSLFQSIVKEKSSLQSSTTIKDKEFAELSHKHEVLRAKLDKAERASVALHEKQAKAEVLMKKVEGLEKQNEKHKVMADRKLLKENELLQKELRNLQSQYDTIATEKKAEMDQLVADRSKFKHKAMELMKELERLRAESNGKEAKLKEDVKELTKRCQQYAEKMNSQKQEFHTTIHNLNSSYDQQKSDFEAQISSFGGQKKAYLERIGQLESDLEILERSIFQKDDQIERLQHHVQKVKAVSESEFENTKLALQKALAEVDQLKAHNDAKQREFEAEMEKMREFLEDAHVEKDREQQRFEEAIMALENTVQQFQSELESVKKIHEIEMETKDHTVLRLRQEMQSSNQEIAMTRDMLNAKDQELNKVNDLYSTVRKDLEESKHVASRTISELEKDLENARKVGEMTSSEKDTEIQAHLQTIRGLEERLEKQGDELSLRIRTLEADREQIQYEFERQMKKTKEILESQSMEIEGLQKQLESAKSQSEAALKELRQLEHSSGQTVVAFEAKISQLNATLENLQDSLNIRDQELVETEEKAIKMQQELEWKLVDQEKRFIENKSILEEKIGNLENSIRQSLKKNEQISIQYQEAQDVIRSMEEHSGKEQADAFSKLQKALNELKLKDSEIEQLQQEMTVTQKKVQSERQSKDTAAMTHNMIQQDLKRTIEESKRRLDQISTEYQLLAKSKKHIEENLAYLDKNACGLIEEKDRMFDQVLGLCASLDMVKGEFELMQVKYETSQGNATEIEALYDVQSSYVVSLEGDLQRMNSLNGGFADMIDSLNETVSGLYKEQIDSQALVDELTSNANDLFEQVQALQAQKSKLVGKLWDAETSLQIEQQKNQHLQANVAQLSSKNQTFSVLIKDLNEQAEQNWKYRLALEKENVELEEQVAHLSLDTQEKSAQEMKLLSTVQGLEMSSKESQELVELNSKEIEQLKIVIGQKEDAIALLNDDLVLERQNVERLKVNVENLNQALADASEKEMEMTKLSADNETKLKGEIDSQLEKVSKLNELLNEKKETLKTVENRLNQREIELIGLQSDLKTLFAEKDDLVKEKSELVQSLESSEAYLSNARQQILELQQELVLKTAKIESSLAEMEEVKSKLDVIAKEKQVLEADLQKEKRNVVSVQSKLDSVTSDNTLLESSVSELNTVINEKSQSIHDLKMELRELETKFNRETAHYQANLEQATSNFASEKEKASKLLEMINLTKQELKHEQEETKIKFEMQASEFKQKEAALKDAIEKLESQVQEAKEQLLEYQEESAQKLSTLTMENDRLQNLANELSGVVDQKTVDCDQAQSDLESARNEADALRRENREVSQTLAHLENRIKKEEDSFKAQLHEKDVYAQKLQASIDNKRKDNEHLLKENHRVNEENKMLRTNSRAEYGKWKQQYAELESEISKNKFQHEAAIRDLQDQLSEKATHCQIVENKLEDALSTISRSELRMANETSSRDLVIRSLEAKLREKTKALDSLESSFMVVNQEKSMLHEQLDQSAVHELEKQVLQSKKDWELEKANLLLRLKEVEAKEEHACKQADRLQILLQETERTLSNEKENYESQLQLLQQRGMLQSSEIKKISELNAELFGHSNSRQKIKHVAQLKEENVHLKEVNLSLSREKDSFKRKLMNTERELEALKSLALGRKKASRASRFISDPSKADKNMIPADEHPDKENQSISYNFGAGMGGISFTVE